MSELVIWNVVFQHIFINIFSEVLVSPYKKFSYRPADLGTQLKLGGCFCNAYLSVLRSLKIFTSLSKRRKLLRYWKCFFSIDSGIPSQFECEKWIMPDIFLPWQLSSVSEGDRLCRPIKLHSFCVKIGKIKFFDQKRTCALWPRENRRETLYIMQVEKFCLHIQNCVKYNYKSAINRAILAVIWKTLKQTRHVHGDSMRRHRRMSMMLTLVVKEWCD